MQRNDKGDGKIDSTVLNRQVEAALCSVVFVYDQILYNATDFGL